MILILKIQNNGLEVKRFVELAVVEKKEVVVAALAVMPPVAFIENKFVPTLF